MRPSTAPASERRLPPLGSLRRGRPWRPAHRRRGDATAPTAHPPEASPARWRAGWRLRPGRPPPRRARRAGAASPGRVTTTASRTWPGERRVTPRAWASRRSGRGGPARRDPHAAHVRPTRRRWRRRRAGPPGRAAHRSAPRRARPPRSAAATPGPGQSRPSPGPPGPRGPRRRAWPRRARPLVEHPGDGQLLDVEPALLAHDLIPARPQPGGLPAPQVVQPLTDLEHEIIQTRGYDTYQQFQAVSPRISEKSDFVPHRPRGRAPASRTFCSVA